MNCAVMSHEAVYDDRYARDLMVLYEALSRDDAHAVESLLTDTPLRVDDPMAFGSALPFHTCALDICYYDKDRVRIGAARGGRLPVPLSRSPLLTLLGQAIGMGAVDAVGVLLQRGAPPWPTKSALINVALALLPAAFVGLGAHSTESALECEHDQSTCAARPLRNTTDHLRPIDSERIVPMLLDAFYGNAAGSDNDMDGWDMNPLTVLRHALVTEYSIKHARAQDHMKRLLPALLERFTPGDVAMPCAMRDIETVLVRRFPRQAPFFDGPSSARANTFDENTPAANGTHGVVQSLRIDMDRDYDMWRRVQSHYCERDAAMRMANEVDALYRYIVANAPLGTDELPRGCRGSPSLSVPFDDATSAGSDGSNILLSRGKECANDDPNGVRAADAPAGGDDRLEHTVDESTAAGLYRLLQRLRHVYESVAIPAAVSVHSGGCVGDGDTVGCLSTCIMAIARDDARALADCLSRSKADMAHSVFCGHRMGSACNPVILALWSPLPEDANQRVTSPVLLADPCADLSGGGVPTTLLAIAVRAGALQCLALLLNNNNNNNSRPSSDTNGGGVESEPLGRFGSVQGYIGAQPREVVLAPVLMHLLASQIHISSVDNQDGAGRTSPLLRTLGSRERWPFVPPSLQLPFPTMSDRDAVATEMGVSNAGSLIQEHWGVPYLTTQRRFDALAIVGQLLRAFPRAPGRRHRGPLLGPWSMNPLTVSRACALYRTGKEDQVQSGSTTVRASCERLLAGLALLLDAGYGPNEPIAGSTLVRVPYTDGNVLSEYDAAVRSMNQMRAGTTAYRLAVAAVQMYDTRTMRRAIPMSNPPPVNTLFSKQRHVERRKSMAKSLCRHSLPRAFQLAALMASVDTHICDMLETPGIHVGAS